MLDDDVMDKKRASSDLEDEAASIIDLCRAGSGTKLLEQSQLLVSRFDNLSQTSAEWKETCEEAMATMQVWETKRSKFIKWVESLEEKLAKQRSTKRPIGTVVVEIEEHYVSYAGIIGLIRE